MMTQRVRRMPSIGQFQQAKNRAADHRGSSVRKAYYDGREVVGPGTGTSDSIPAMLSNGEDVIPDDSVTAIGGGSHAAGVRKIGKLIDATHTPVHKQRGIASMPPGLAPDTALGYDDGGQVTSTGDPNAARNAAVDAKSSAPGSLVAQSEWGGDYAKGGSLYTGGAIGSTADRPANPSAPVNSMSTGPLPLETQQGSVAAAVPDANRGGQINLAPNRPVGPLSPNGVQYGGGIATRPEAQLSRVSGIADMTNSPGDLFGAGARYANGGSVNSANLPTAQYANGGPIRRAMYANGGAIAKYADGGDANNSLVGKAAGAISGRQAQLDAQEAAALGKAPPPTKATVPQAQTSDGTTTQPTPSPKRKGLFGLGILGLADGGPTRPVLRLADGTPDGIPRDQWGNPSLVGSIDQSNQTAPASQAAANGVAGPDTPDVYQNAPQPTRGPFPAPQAIARATYPQSADVVAQPSRDTGFSIAPPPGGGYLRDQMEQAGKEYDAGNVGKAAGIAARGLITSPLVAVGESFGRVGSDIGRMAATAAPVASGLTGIDSLATPAPARKTIAGAGPSDNPGGNFYTAPPAVDRTLQSVTVPPQPATASTPGMTTEQANTYYGSLNAAGNAASAVRDAANAQNMAAARNRQDIGNAAISADWDARTAARNAHVSASSILNGPDAVGYRQGFGTGAGRAAAAESAGIADAARTHANALAANYAGQPGASLTTQAIAAQGAGQEAQRSDLAGQAGRQAIAQATQLNPLLVSAEHQKLDLGNQALTAGATQLAMHQHLADLSQRAATAGPGQNDAIEKLALYQKAYSGKGPLTEEDKAKVWGDMASRALTLGGVDAWKAIPQYQDFSAALQPQQQFPLPPQSDIDLLAKTPPGQRPLAEAIFDKHYGPGAAQKFGGKQ